MKTTNVITVAILAATLASPSVAQVAASFDDLVDDVLAGVNTSFFSGATNTAAINASVNITAGADIQAGTLSIVDTNVVETTNTSFEELTLDGAAEFTDLDVTSDSGPNGSDTDRDELSGSFNFQFSELERLDDSISSDTSNTFDLTVNNVTQEFGRISTVAAGAINDSTITLTQTGSLASSAVNTTGSNTSFIGDASNTTGTALSAIQGSFNTAAINASVTMGMANVNGGATSIDTVAAGAINAGGITATFIGGSDAETSVSP